MAVDCNPQTIAIQEFCGKWNLIHFLCAVQPVVTYQHHNGRAISNDCDFKVTTFNNTPIQLGISIDMEYIQTYLSDETIDLYVLNSTGSFNPFLFITRLKGIHYETDQIFGFMYKFRANNVKKSKYIPFQFIVEKWNISMTRSMTSPISNPSVESTQALTLSSTSSASPTSISLSSTITTLKSTLIPTTVSYTPVIDSITTESWIQSRFNATTINATYTPITGTLVNINASYTPIAGTSININDTDTTTAYVNVTVKRIFDIGLESTENETAHYTKRDSYEQNKISQSKLNGFVAGGVLAGAAVLSAIFVAIKNTQKIRTFFRITPTTVAAFSQTNLRACPAIARLP